MSRRVAPTGLPGVVLGALELPAPDGSVPDHETWELRLADLSPGSWGRRITSPRHRGALLGFCDGKRHILWACPRQNNVAVAQTITHEIKHGLYPAVRGTRKGEQWAEVVERVVGAMLRCGVLRLTLRDRQLDAARRQLLGAAESAPYESTGRLEGGPVPWVRGLGPAEVGP